MNATLLSSIENHPFLQNLPKNVVETMAEFAMETHFQPNHFIFRRGDTANRFYLILEGRVQLGSFGEGQEGWVETIGASDVLGWSWMFEPRCWQFDARADGPVKAIFFYATPLLAMCEDNPEMGYELMKWSASVMLQRLQAVRKRLATERDFHGSHASASHPPRATEPPASYCGIPMRYPASTTVAD